MIGVKVTVTDSTARVSKAVEKSAFRNLGHASASISKDAKASISNSDEASEPGQPPHSRKGQLRRAIRYAADKEGAVIGPMASVVDGAGAAHEFGTEHQGQDFPERPYMGPALDRAIPRFAGDWRGSVGE